MSSHSTSASSTAAANQALIALVARLTEMVEDIIWLPSQEEKMELSRKIAREVNDAIRAYGKEASYVPPGLLSLAAEILRAQRRTTQLVEIPDWTCLGHNQDMCMKHPLYSKTLGDVPPIAPAAPATAPVPRHLCHMSAFACPDMQHPVSLHRQGRRKHGNVDLSTSPPLPRANRSQKPVIKSKEILSDTDTDTEKVKGKGKAKAKAPEVDGDEDDDFIDVDDLPDVEPQKSTCKAVIPAKKPGTLKASQLVVSEGDEEVDELEEDEEAQGRSKASHCTTREATKTGRICIPSSSKGKGTSRKAKVQEQPPTDGSLPPCDRCRAKKVECCPRLTKKGDVASTCSLCHLWKMACIRTNTASATIAPTTNTAPPVAAVTTHSKTTRSKATGKKMGQKI
ncbi:hypothetical protein DFJ58DRAFT_723172 [Suillus subalutaceus]|uniref:uncharacterized protein n=1 Tax=Suillus subalutaceus TaxID=48586 RepID=UPI001B8861C8|nr:uncharacterized protein DFJ58DRAFT_723172 [Suillus subalutaceus]KAG1870275.1 hypothetical protein DFJ58DRAFT_723172 [Suillus subalutaceus]